MQAKKDAEFVISNFHNVDPLSDQWIAVMQAYERAMTCVTGKRKLKNITARIESLAKHNTATNKTLVTGLCQDFPPGSDGRKFVLNRIKESTNSTSKEMYTLTDVPVKTQEKQRAAVRKAQHGAAKQVRISNQSVQTGSTRQKLSKFELTALKEFTLSESSPKSGANRDNTCYMDQTKAVFYARYRASYPGLLRIEAEKDIKYASSVKDRPADPELSIHDKNVWAAKYLSEQGTDDYELTQQRLEVEMTRLTSCAWELKGEREPVAGLFTVEQQARLGVDEYGQPISKDASVFNPATWVIIPRAYETVMSHIEKLNIHLHTTKDAHECNLCTKGPMIRIKLETLRKDIVEKYGHEDKAPPPVRTELHQLKVHDDKYDTHLKQLVAQRANAKDIETNLKEHQGVLYRDFVCSYAIDGTKIMNLVFVYLERRNGAIQQTNIHCISGEVPPSADWYYYADCMTHLIKNCSIFDGITELFVIGDHGPHFIARESFFFESTIFQKSREWRSKRNIESGLSIHSHFLCSYHAYNRCDGIGASVKMAALRLALTSGSKGWPTKPSEYVEMINSGSTRIASHNTTVNCAVFFESTNRSEVLMPNLRQKPNSNWDATKGLRGQCEVKYVFTNADGTEGRMEGIILHRKVSGVGEFVVVDLLPTCSNGRGHLCNDCSRAVARPVHHKDEGTKCLDYARVVDESMVPAEADKTRFTGRQAARKGKPKKTATPTVPLRACLHAFCKQKGYKWHTQSMSKKLMVQLLLKEGVDPTSIDPKLTWKRDQEETGGAADLGSGE